MTEQLQLRRGTATQAATFTGAQGEVIVDTTNNRAIVNDGATAGGWPAAKLAEVVTNTRTTVSDAAYTALATDRSIAYAALTAARVVTLPASSAYPLGTTLTVFDESGACSATKTIALAVAGSDAIDGASSAVISSAYGFLALQSNGAGKWTIIDQAASNLGPVGIGTPADPNNPLSVYGQSALFNGATNMNVTVNKNGSGATASFIFEDAFSGRAQMGLNGSDNFSFKVSPNGSSWVTAIGLDATTGAATFANLRTPVSDAAYSALITDRLIAYTALTAARIVMLPATASYPAGQALTIIDESGACSPTDTITLSPNGSDTINGGASFVLQSTNAYAALESNGAGKWTVVDQSSPPISALPSVYFLAFTIRGVQLNTTGDTPIPIALPTGFSLYYINAARIANPSASLSAGSARAGLYTAPSQGGVAMVSQTALTAITATAPNTPGNMTSMTLNNPATTALNAATLYFNVGTANGSNATVDVTVVIGVQG
jgi:hypothetical protein